MARALVGAMAGAIQRAGVRPRQRVLVAVSGGVDSMALLDALVRLMPRLEIVLHVAHIHHGLRGRSADRDAALVSAAAARHGLPVTVERLAAETRPRGVSVETWARAARYARLEVIRQRVRASWILTAHTENDQAETVLLNLLRGTGPRGLAGIPGMRDRILRPLLSVSRAEIDRYAARRGVRFREDPSNRSLAHLRNRVRHRLLPMLAREYNPRIVAALAALATQAREDDETLESAAAALAARALHRRGVTIGVNAARALAAPPALARRLFREAFRRADAGQHGLTRRHVAALAHLAACAGRGQVALPGGLRAWASGGTVWLGPMTPPAASRRSHAKVPRLERAPELPVRPGRWVQWAPGRCGVRVSRVTAKGVRFDARDPDRELLSPAVLDGPLSLRPWRPGDRFHPLGLAGTKKLQDFFMDAKIPRAERARVPLLLSGGRIAWVVGRRISEEFRWKGERTACLAEVRFLEERHGVPTGSDAAVRR